MKTSKYAAISGIITLIMLVFLIAALVVPEENVLLQMLSMTAAELFMGSWILTLIQLIYSNIKKKDISGRKSYSILMLVLLVIDGIFVVISSLLEGGFKGSSGELTLFYIMPVLLFIYGTLWFAGIKKELKEK